MTRGERRWFQDHLKATELKPEAVEFLRRLWASEGHDPGEFRVVVEVTRRLLRITSGNFFAVSGIPSID